MRQRLLSAKEINRGVLGWTHAMVVGKILHLNIRVSTTLWWSNV